MCPAAAIAAPVAGGIVGQLASQGDVNAQQGDLQQAEQAYANINVPTIAEQQWNLADETQQGELTPQQLATMQMGPNALGGIQTNPAYAQAQQNALTQLGQLGQGGLTAQEKQNLITSNQQAAGQANSANAAVAQQMAARGVGGSGVQLAAQLSNGQNAANMAANQSNAINSMAQQQALGAVAQQGGLSTQMQGQQFGQQAAIAQAQNAINQFNTQNAQSVAGYNTGAANQAQAGNLANQQNIANTNVGLSNQQQAHNTGLYQQQFGDQMQQAQGKAGALSGEANFEGQQAKNTAGMWSGIGSGVGSAAAAMSGGSNNGGQYEEDDWQGGQVGSHNYFQGGMINPPDYSRGGEVKGGLSDKEALHLIQKLAGHERAEIKQGYSQGGNVQGNPGGSSASWQPTYADGGMVTPQGPKVPQAPSGMSPQQLALIMAQMGQTNRGGVTSPMPPQAPQMPQGMSPAQLASVQAILAARPNPASGNLTMGMPSPGQVPQYNPAPITSPTPGMNRGGEVSTLGMNSYANGGEISDYRKQANKGELPTDYGPNVPKQMNGRNLSQEELMRLGAILADAGGDEDNMAHGGMVHYDNGGSVDNTPQDLAPYMPTPQEEASSGLPPGPQRAMYIANRKKQAADAQNIAKDNAGYAVGGMVSPQITPQQLAMAKMAAMRAQRPVGPVAPQAMPMPQRPMPMAPRAFADGGTVGQAMGHPFSQLTPEQLAQLQAARPMGGPATPRVEDAQRFAAGMANAPVPAVAPGTIPSGLGPTGQMQSKYQMGDAEDSVDKAAQQQALANFLNKNQMANDDSLPNPVNANNNYAKGGNVAHNMYKPEINRMYEGGDLTGLPHAPPSKKMDSNDGEQVMAKGGAARSGIGMGMWNQGGNVPAKVSPGEKYLNPTEVEQLEKGKAKPKQVGQMVPGKAKVKGDSPKNDTVETNLEEGGVVIPRSKVNASDNDILNFVHKVRNKR
jgi:hypothetical protein